MLKSDKAVLAVIDVQGRLAESMWGREALFRGVRLCIRGAQALGVPILWTEQYPEGLGPTSPEIAELLTGLTPIPKRSFSCYGCKAFVDALHHARRRQVLLVGIEAHVCIFQTARDLLATGHDVHVASDAVSSRTEENRRIGLDRIRAERAVITSVEMALFEMLGDAEGDAFKAVLKIVR